MYRFVVPLTDIRSSILEMSAAVSFATGTEPIAGFM